MTTASPRSQLCIVTHRCAKNDGQGRVNYEIAKAALLARWHVMFVGSELANDLAIDPRVTWIKIDVAGIPTNLLKYQIFARRSAKVLRRAACTSTIVHANGFITWHRADVNTAHFVHSGWLNSGFFPYRWWRSPYQAYQHLFTALNARLEKQAFREARVVVAVSNKIGVELERIGVSSRDIATIPNGVDLAEFRPGPSDRKQFGLPGDVTVALFAGDIRTSRKNLQTVLRALVDVPQCHLAVAGRLAGSPYPALARALGVAERVYFLDTVKDVPSLMRSVDFFVLPSRYEPLGLVLLEAMASGLPVLTAKTAGGAELLGNAGRVLENPNDEALLAAWMRELSTDRGLRETMGSCARTIAEGYSWADMGQRYLELYRRVSSAETT